MVKKLIFRSNGRGGAVISVRGKGDINRIFSVVGRLTNLTRSHIEL